MYARVLRLKTDPGKVDEGISRWKEGILPLIKKQKGFAGVSTMGNRKTGEGMSVAYWETEQAMKDARAQVRPEADKVMAGFGGQIVEEDECEVAVQERFQPPKNGTWVRAMSAEGDPARISDLISTFKTSAVPIVKQHHGGRAAILLVNRKAGKILGGTVWDTEKDLQDSQAAASSVMRQATQQIGASNQRVDVFEVYYTEIPAAVISR